MSRQLPSSIMWMLRLTGALMVLCAVAVVLTKIQGDDVILAWAQGNSSAQEILATGGIEALREAAIVPKFFPLALVSFVVYAVIIGVLCAFVVGGHGWARLVLTLTLGFGALVSLLGLGFDMPVVFVVLAVVSLVLYVATIVFLWRKDATHYLRVN